MKKFRSQVICQGFLADKKQLILSSIFPFACGLNYSAILLPSRTSWGHGDAKEFIETETYLMRIKIERGEFNQKNVANADGSC